MVIINSTRFSTFIAFLVLFKLPLLYADANLSWPEKNEAVGYFGEISPTPDFRNPIIKFSTPENEYSITQELPEGDYYFRVRYMDEFKRMSSFSNVARVRVKILADGPNYLGDKILKLSKRLETSKVSFRFMPSSTSSKINSKNSNEFTPVSFGIDGKIRDEEITHSVGLFYLNFQKNSQGYLSYVDYRLHLLRNNLYYGPSIEFMKYNLIYKNTGEVNGGLLTAGGHLGWQSSSEMYPFTILIDANSSYDLKGYLIKSDVTKVIYNGEHFNLSVGLKYRLLNYTSDDKYNFSALGMHFSLEKF